MSDMRPRGLGRGLSALLGEPVKTEAPKSANNVFGQPQAQPRPEQPRAPIEPPRNVFELPITQAAPTPAPANEAVAPPVVAAPAQAAADAAGPRSVPIDLVQRNPQQPRKHFDEAELNDLASSIKSQGVLQPILVRPIADGKYEIVAGERRWRAAQRAGLHSIPAVIRERNEVEALEIAIVENVQRMDLNPIEEAQGFQALIDRFDHTQQDVDDLLKSLYGFTVQMSDGPRVLNTKNADVQPLQISFIEQFLMLLTDPNIAFLLIAIGVQSVLIEISSPGGWVAGFIGVVCLTLATYGLGVLPVNWFGFIFLITAFVLSSSISKRPRMAR